jgi:ketosteroid isomerase-like protein
MNPKTVACGGTLVVVGLILAAAPVMAADPSDLAGRVVTWEKNYNADDTKAVAAMYTEDGCRMPPNQATVHGREGIQGQLDAGKKQGIAKVKLGLTSTTTSGDMAYGMGTYQILNAQGTAVDHGKWMNVSKKVGAEWKTYCDIWNSDVPLPAPTK